MTDVAQKVYDAASAAVSQLPAEAIYLTDSKTFGYHESLHTKTCKNKVQV